MYSIFLENAQGAAVCVYDDTSPSARVKVISPKLTVEDNAAGSLEFDMPPGNLGYDIEFPIGNSVKVFKRFRGTEKIIWEGRVASLKRIFNNTKTFYCEGALSFLNDTLQSHRKITAANLSGYLGTVLSFYNSYAPANRKIFLGAVSTAFDSMTSAGIERWTDYETTYEAISEAVKDCVSDEAHIRVRRETDEELALRNEGAVNPDTTKRLLLDVLDDEDCFRDTDHRIIYGKNLLDLTEENDISEIVTVLLPLGAALENQNAEDGEPSQRVTIQSASVPQGCGYRKTNVSNSIRLTHDTGSDPSTATKYGRFEKKVIFDDIEDPQALMEAAILYMDEHKIEEASLTIDAMDGIFAGIDTTAMELYDWITLISVPHKKNLGTDDAPTVVKMPIVKIETELDNPGSEIFTINKIKKSITDEYR